MTSSETDLVIGIILAVIGIVLLRAVWSFFSGVMERYSRKGVRTLTAETAAPTIVSSKGPSSPDSKDGGLEVTPPSDGKPTKSYSGRLFISYRREDSRDATGRLYDRLVADFGRATVFKDVDSLPLGDDFRAHLETALANAAVVLAVIGPDWTGRSHLREGRRIDEPQDFVRIELAFALERHVPIVPVLVREAQMPAAAELPESLVDLAYRNAIHLRADPDFHADVDRLVRAIKHILSRSQRAA